MRNSYFYELGSVFWFQPGTNADIEVRLKSEHRLKLNQLIFEFEFGSYPFDCKIPIRERPNLEPSVFTRSECETGFGFEERRDGMTPFRIPKSTNSVS
jgi:hypothetical protein